MSAASSGAQHERSGEHTVVVRNAADDLTPSPSGTVVLYRMIEILGCINIKHCIVYIFVLRRILDTVSELSHLHQANLNSKSKSRPLLYFVYCKIQLCRSLPGLKNHQLHRKRISQFSLSKESMEDWMYVGLANPASAWSFSMAKRIASVHFQLLSRSPLQTLQLFVSSCRLLSLVAKCMPLCWRTMSPKGHTPTKFH